MSTTSFSAFRRAFRRRELFRGAPRQAFFWSFLASLFLGLLLCDLFLLAGLLVHRGELALTLERENLADFQRRTGILVRSPGGEPVTYAALDFDNRGILPSVWRSRDHIWGDAVGGLYRRLPGLRRTIPALVTLLIAAALLWILRRLALARVHSLSWQTAFDTATWLRRSIHRQTMRIAPGDLEGREGQNALDLFTTEADRLHEGLSKWIYAWTRAPFELIVLVTFVLCLDWLLALQWFLPLALGGYLLMQVRQRREANRRLADDRAQTEKRHLAEALQRTRLVRSYGMENFEYERFQTHLQRHRDSQRAEESFEWTRLFVDCISLALLTLLMYLLTIKVLNAPEALSLGEAIAFLAAFALMWQPLDLLSRQAAEQEKVSLAAGPIFRFLDQIPAVGQAVGAKFLQPLAKSLHFESVAYALPNSRKLLNGIDLKLDAGRAYAIVSLDPLEARALASLLPRFIEPQSGRILFDGEDIAWATLESLRAETIYVSANDPPFTGSVLENLRCGRDEYTLQQVTEAAKQTHAHNFVSRLYNGYETIIGEHGERIGPGPNLRLGLARAILRNPALLIIEESSALLDEDTKSLLEDAYSRITRNRTVLFLPARLSTLRRADQIILLRNGRVEAIGNHANLVRESPLYRHWEYMRFNEFRHDENG